MGRKVREAKQYLTRYLSSEMSADAIYRPSEADAISEIKAIVDLIADAVSEIIEEAQEPLRAEIAALSARLNALNIGELISRLENLEIDRDALGFQADALERALAARLDACNEDIAVLAEQNMELAARLKALDEDIWLASHPPGPG